MEQKLQNLNKNILLVASEFPPMPGGIGNHAYCLAQELARLKYSVTVLTEQREQQHGEWSEFVRSNPEIKIIGVRRKRIDLVTYFLRVLQFYKLLFQISDLTVIFSGKFPVWLSGIAPRRRSIVVVHGSEIKQTGYSKRWFEKGLQKADFIVCVSNYTKAQLISHYPNLDAAKIVIINNGFKSLLTADSTCEKEINLPRLNLVTVGGIHKRKGQFNVVEALPEIIKIFPDCRYHIVGLPLEKAELLNLIGNKKVTDHVSFYHGLSDTEVRERLKASDVFMMLSEHLENGDFEGFGIAIMEAMALGLPAIGTRDSGIADAIKDEFSGKLVDPKDTAEIVQALEEITKDYSRYSADAGSWAEGFQWKHKVTEYDSLIKRL